MFSLDKNKINLSKEIGEGVSGSVHPYQDYQDDMAWVVKIMPTKDPEELIRYFQEIVFGLSFNHPHVLPVESFWIDYDKNEYKWTIYLKLPRMACSLTKLMSNKQPTEDHIIKHFYDLTCALHYLHIRGIAHCDIKPENLLLDNHGRIILADPGIAKSVWDDLHSIVKDVQGTPSYWAPEISKNKNLPKEGLVKADLWSLGVIMLEICLGQLKIFAKVAKEEKDDKRQEILVENLEELNKKGYSPILVELISSLLKIDPAERKSLQEVKETLEKKFDFREKVTCMYKETETNSSFSIRGRIESREKQIEEFKIEEPKFKNEENETFTKFLEDHKKEFEIKIDFEKNFKFKKAKNFDAVNDEHLKKLMQEFTEVQNKTKIREIRQLEINLLNCEQITDDGVKEVAQNIGLNLKNVEQLTIALGAYRCDKITDKSVKELAYQIISNLKSIRQLDLSFFSFKTITDDGIIGLAQLIGSNLKEIQKLELSFDDCWKITDIGFNKLAEELGSKVDKLKELSLNFSYTRVSQEAKQKFKASCVSIPIVNIY